MRYLCYDTALNEEYTLIQLLQRYPHAVSLFSGTDDEGIWDAAPWIFEVNTDCYAIREEDTLIRLDRCIIFETAEPREEVIRFLQGLFYKNTAEGPVYLRVWDARVLLDSFREWGEKDRQVFFEFFDCFYTEGAEPGSMDRWVLDKKQDLVAEERLLSGLFPEERVEDPGAAAAPGKKGFEGTAAPPPGSEPDPPPKRRRFFIE